MTNIISFTSANYVARHVGYNMTDWAHGDKATNDYFRPLETYGERFEAMLRDIQALGFEAIDLWLSHLHYHWATDEHIAIARDLLNKHRLKVASIGGWFGSTPQEFEMSCKIAVALGTTILGGMTSVLKKDRAFVSHTLKERGLKLGIENHPEKSPAEVLAQIGNDGAGAIGATVDTGWFGTQGYDAALALAELGDYVFHVHLKDVLAPGAHETCRYGHGVVPIERCVQTLKQIGYAGAISVEHEPEHFDPTEDIRASLQMLGGWLGHYE